MQRKGSGPTASAPGPGNLLAAASTGLFRPGGLGSRRIVNLCRVLPFVCAVFLSTTVACIPAELPEPLKSAAARYDADMKALDASVATQAGMARDAYAQTLLFARRVAEGAKQSPALAAIDADIAALRAGPLPAEPPENLPVPVAAARVQYRTALARAEASAEPVRRGTRERYLKYLAGLEKVIRGRDANLEKAIADEVQRASEPAEATGK